MSHQVVPGLSFKQSRKVTKEDTASSYGSGFLDVFATPAMIAFMEHTSLMAVQKYLDPGFGTVGTNVCISHLRATPEGMIVECTAILKEVNANSLVFNVVVTDEDGKVGEGTHTRYIINEERFMKKFVQKKGK
jgi:fluoroacetyl-CoA thioesterase